MAGTWVAMKVGEMGEKKAVMWVASMVFYWVEMKAAWMVEKTAVRMVST